MTFLERYWLAKIFRSRNLSDDKRNSALRFIRKLIYDCGDPAIIVVWNLALEVGSVFGIALFFEACLSLKGSLLEDSKAMAAIIDAEAGSVRSKTAKIHRVIGNLTIWSGR